MSAEGPDPVPDGSTAVEKGSPSVAWHDRPLLLVFAFCLLFEITFVLLDLFVNWYRWSDSGAIRRLFNITREDGLASLFAIVQTLAIALTVWIIYLLSRHMEVSKAVLAGWLVLALFFSYMVIDDGAMVHERIGSAFKKANQEVELPSYAWQFVMAPLFVLMGIFMAGFLWKLGGRQVKRGWLLAALACLGLAVAMDYVEGMDSGYSLLVEGLGWPEKTIAHFTKSIEEFLEMLGMTFLLILFLNYLGFLTEKIEIRIADRRVSFLASEDQV